MQLVRVRNGECLGCYYAMRCDATNLDRQGPVQYAKLHLSVRSFRSAEVPACCNLPVYKSITRKAMNMDNRLGRQDSLHRKTVCSGLHLDEFNV